MQISHMVPCSGSTQAQCVPLLSLLCFPAIGLFLSTYKHAELEYKGKQEIRRSGYYLLEGY